MFKSKSAMKAATCEPNKSPNSNLTLSNSNLSKEDFKNAIRNFKLKFNKLKPLEFN